MCTELRQSKLLRTSLQTSSMHMVTGCCGSQPSVCTSRREFCGLGVYSAPLKNLNLNQTT
ncbi:hypothetical protein DPMN_059098 [Dreissena polymorpha]|uniref:Uncharacterized protein n=1 Tax=Dreissena polymorpha TaxID=45954 RepID=A0A9D4HGX5_DREPO|nr:hypothetical protein DPMN_059098 [Dreissena polymorpha]